ncbi:MAG TPA: HesA/MoeB/ThiF family protein [Candidatus Methanoperedens sp.]
MVIEITDPKTDRYSRQRLISWWDQESLASASVMVVGIGALGNEVAKNLAQVGVGNLFLVDFDFVEPSNLTRSVLFRDDDDGRKKVEVAAHRLKEINPGIKIHTFHGDVSDLGLGVFRRMNMVIGCLDNREARLSVNRACWKVGIPWIDGAIQELSGTVKIFIPPDSACYECTMSEKDYELLNIRYSCPLLKREDIVMGKIPTVATISSVIGGIQAQEAIKLIHGIGDSAGKCITYVGLTNYFDVVRFQRNENCLSHDSFSDIIELDHGADTLTGSELINIAKRISKSEDCIIELDREVITGRECKACGFRDESIYLLGKLTMQKGSCPKCGSLLELMMTHVIKEGETLSNITLGKVGVPGLHIITVRNSERYMYFELSKDSNSIFI